MGSTVAVVVFGCRINYYNWVDTSWQQREGWQRDFIKSFSLIWSSESRRRKKSERATEPRRGEVYVHKNEHSFPFHCYSVFVSSLYIISLLIPLVPVSYHKLFWSLSKRLVFLLNLNGGIGKTVRNSLGGRQLSLPRSWWTFIPWLRSTTRVKSRR